MSIFIHLEKCSVSNLEKRTIFVRLLMITILKPLQFYNDSREIVCTFLNVLKPCAMTELQYTSIRLLYWWL